jgi:hypothetical protein
MQGFMSLTHQPVFLTMREYSSSRLKALILINLLTSLIATGKLFSLNPKNKGLRIIIQIKISSRIITLKTISPCRSLTSNSNKNSSKSSKNN